MRARLAVSPGPDARYGPSIATLPTPGPSGRADVSVDSVTVAPYSRNGGCSTPSCSHDRPANDTPTTRVPAPTWTRTARSSSAPVR